MALNNSSESLTPNHTDQGPTGIKYPSALFVIPVTPDYVRYVSVFASSRY